MNRVQQLVRDDIQRSHINYNVNSDGDLVFHPTINNVNGYSTIHGGILMTLADNSMIARSYLYHNNSDIIHVTKHIEYKFLYPAMLDMDINFVSTITSNSDRILVGTCYITQGDKLIGIATGSYKTIVRMSKL